MFPPIPPFQLEDARHKLARLNLYPRKNSDGTWTIMQMTKPVNKT